MEVQEQIGIFICTTTACPKRNAEVEYPWAQEWPLAKRQRKCKSCRKRMLFYKIKRVMTEAAKQKLAERRKRIEEET